MFNRRAKIMLGILAAMALALVARLIDLQVMQADDLRERAKSKLKRPARQIPTVRGRIFDRDGRILAEDRPGWELRVYYPVIDAEQVDRYITRRSRVEARESRQTTQPVSRADAADRMRGAISRMWDIICAEAGLTPEQLAARRGRVVRRVKTIAEIVSTNEGMSMDVHEQTQFHPIAWGMDDQESLGLRSKLGPMRWVEVEVANRRVYTEAHATSLCHVLGSLGEVTRAVVYGDPNNESADPLVRYEPGDLMGYSGVEKLGERVLRGRRGMIREDIKGDLLGRDEPVPGRDLRLSIDANLQQAVLAILADAVESNEDARGGGGAAVVLDIDTREILALVSYPLFDANRRLDAMQAARTAKTTPMVFRAVGGRYPPGSVAKPIALAAGLSLGVVTPDHTETCTGYLFPGVNRWRCWTVARHLPPHGPVNACDAIKYSCNIYFYKLGEALGGDRLTQWQQMFGLGRLPGTGLIEESAGVVPTPGWLAEHRGRAMRVGDARNLALGQGDIMASPLQMANMAATVATGRWRSPTILADDTRERPMWTLPVSDAHWGVIRDGMYRVVNERRGTAYHSVRLDEIELCGKSGSAQAGPPATHAWFMAYGPRRRPKVAVVAMIEHGGGGGRVAGPVVKAIFRQILTDSPEYVGIAHRP